MISAYVVLGVRSDASDREIRDRYLQLVRAHPPSREPERFQQVTEAYEAVKDRRARIETKLFGIAGYDSFDELVTDLERAGTPSWKPPGLRALIDVEDI